MLEGQAEVKETSGREENIQVVPQRQDSATNMSRRSVKIEPLALISRAKLYAINKKDLKSGVSFGGKVKIQRGDFFYNLQRRGLKSRNFSAVRVLSEGS